MKQDPQITTDVSEKNINNPEETSYYVEVPITTVVGFYINGPENLENSMDLRYVIAQAIDDGTISRTDLNSYDEEITDGSKVKLSSENLMKYVSYKINKIYDSESDEVDYEIEKTTINYQIA